MQAKCGTVLLIILITLQVFLSHSNIAVQRFQRFAVSLVVCVPIIEQFSISVIVKLQSLN